MYKYKNIIAFFVFILLFHIGWQIIQIFEVKPGRFLGIQLMTAFIMTIVATRINIMNEKKSINIYGYMVFMQLIFFQLLLTNMYDYLIYFLGINLTTLVGYILSISIILVYDKYKDRFINIWLTVFIVWFLHIVLYMISNYDMLSNG